MRIYEINLICGCGEEMATDTDNDKYLWLVEVRPQQWHYATLFECPACGQRVFVKEGRVPESDLETETRSHEPEVLRFREEVSA